MNKLERIGEPIRPMSIPTVLQHLRVEEDAEALELTLIERYTDAALEWAADFTRQEILAQRYRLTLSPAGAEVDLPRPPLLSVESVTVGGVALDPGGYSVDRCGWPGRLSLAEEPAGEVVVEFTAGYSEETLPRKIHQAVLLLVGHWYESRQEVVIGTITAEVPMAAKALLWMSRMGL